ncbi:MAG: hypothetical protein CL946_10225 [Ectothiorhodospiraceae bacterium]|nr:hypothetical protein [Ectothiorhodospiraceae bacterium]
MNVVRDTYCRTIGYEYMHIQDRDQKRWFRSQAEGKPRNTWLTLDEKRRILEMLTEAEAFEKFLHTKYLGHKRFSLEGAETLIPVMDLLLQDAGNTPTTDVVVGMAHRGRLNMLANILGKSYQKIFKEFSGDVDPDTMQGSGDVKYHLGARGVFTTKTGKEMKIFLASNPSHLEAVDPVVEGMARALQDMKLDAQHRMVLPVLIHGDAAFAGQGVVSETLNLSKVPGYRTGGTVHIIVNNLIGFTTSPEEARSSVYATDVAKAVQAPIFHVNGDDPEAAARVIRLALAFRQEFQKDVVVDIMCYRKHGHNETDDPSYTQPKMYSHIKEKRSIRKLYTELLVNRGDITLDEAEQSMEQFHKRLEEAFEATKDQGKSKPNKDNVIFEVPAEDVGEIVETGVSHESLELIAGSFNRFPNGFTVHPKLEKLFKERSKVIENGEVDWPVAELLAFGSILLDGKVVRLAGQDSKRGTFSQRHSVAIDYKTEEAYYPLANLSADQGKFRIFDSTLSEFAALGFEYGYSVMFESALVIWEAQFGDFVNGAQVIIDQFIAAAEDKWNQQSRLTMLLPHGFEGQGPEHSSARLERFLILCAENNMRVTYPTSAAQYFHLLRRQAALDDRKPLIVLTPKSLLRAKEVRSPIEALEEGSFQFTLDDPNPPKKPDRLLLCTGKIAYDLLKHRDENEISDTAIVRIEQLYPFPFDDIEKIFRKYDQVRDVRWVQEEPRNMGAWNFVYGKLRDRLEHPYTLHFVGRLVSGSPATGSGEVHAIEQEYLIQQAFGDIEDLD